jgi:hypothetical protein
MEGPLYRELRLSRAHRLRRGEAIKAKYGKAEGDVALITAIPGVGSLDEPFVHDQQSEDDDDHEDDQAISACSP